jgi:hypothetical protein
MMQIALVFLAFAASAAYLGWGLWRSLSGSCGGCGGKKPASDGLISPAELTARVRAKGG